jgi:hypothetical protein
VTATLNLLTGTGTLANATAVVASGLWAFSALTVTGAGSGTITFSDGALTTVTSATVTWGSSDPASATTLPGIVDQFRPPTRRAGLRVVPSTSPLIGTGGLVAVASNTVSVHVPVGRVTVSILSLALDAMVAAVGSGAITVQVSKVTATGTVSAVTDAVSIKADVITAAGNIALPMRAAVFDGPSNGDRRIDGTTGDYLRVDITAAGTVTTQPQLRVVAELAVNG